MANLQESEAHEDLGLAENPADLLTEFYLLNGYRPEDSRPEDPPADAPAPGEQSVLKFRRGKSGNSWWTSNMCELFTRVEISCSADAVTFDYHIQTTGQLLTQAERGFWGAERRAAIRYVRGVTETPEDLQIRESARAKKLSKSFLSVGIWGGICAFFLVVILGFLGVI